MKPTDVSNFEYFHKVVDCQFACPAHTPVPEYIRLIADGRYTQAYMINWESNVFPGILGRTCDRPCEPACRRGRIDEKPVAICRLKRVAADHKGDVTRFMPKVPEHKNGRKIALIGAGPASLTVARDLMPLGYSVDLYDEQANAGGFMRSQIPSFRLPVQVMDQELGYILDMGVMTHFQHRVDSMKSLLEQDYDAIFVGTGAPRGRDLPKLPGRQEADANIHIGIDWLASVAFEHTTTIGRRVLVLGGGNTAMDCCRTARRLGGEDVRVVVRSPQVDMKASSWEIEDALHEDIPVYENHAPKSFVMKKGKLVGMYFDRMYAEYDEKGKRTLHSTKEEPVFMPCDDVLMALGQLNAFTWIEKDSGIELDRWGMPVLNETTFQSSIKRVFFGGDAAFGPKNIITAVAHGHQAAISIHNLCQDVDVGCRPPPEVTLIEQEMGFHEWIYASEVSDDERYTVPLVDKAKALRDRLLEVELGFDPNVGYAEAMRCLNCDVQTVFSAVRCIECDACADICPTNCINFITNGEEDDLRNRLYFPATNLAQDIFVSDPLKTARVMVKDENLCLHCGVCAERCPTAAWDMQKFLYHTSKAGASWIK
ncbi:MAG TPA: 4Fe-4S dicluster domain-containing protein [Gammaproteobacteria bacterium]|nr:4Fe-4S dicluster domain-containing protein [Gammaproteobacteria bacterium]